MKSKHFLVPKRFRLAAVKHHPEIEYAEYEQPPIDAARAATVAAGLPRNSRARDDVLEGWDTAGKGGIVRRLGWALDPRSFRVHPIAAPTSHERVQHYLQRFWERLPEHGQIVVFDRSWYGRVLVERVEELASPREWKRAYREINEFENAVKADGIRLVKIFLHITPEEQIRRFKDRLTNPLKRWKLSYEDFRNRARLGRLRRSDRADDGGDLNPQRSLAPGGGEQQEIRAPRRASRFSSIGSAAACP